MRKTLNSTIFNELVEDDHDVNVFFIKQAEILEKINYSLIDSPRITNQTAYKKAERKPHPYLDKVELHQNVIIALKTPGSDLTVLPLEFNVDIFGKWRTGQKMLYGNT